MRLNISILTLLCFSLIAKADVRLPAIIGDHMVLQQKSDVKLWGWCDPSEKIKIQNGWNSTIDSATGNADGKWMITIKTPEASGPYKISINGRNAVALEDVMIGEVWLCSGQSNMEMSYSWGNKQYDEDVANANNKEIRFFHLPRTTSEYPQDDTKGEWVVCNPEDLNTFSLAGYYFGQKLNKTLKVPVGLIESAWGGTPAEVWTPKEAIESNPTLKKIADAANPIPWGPIRPAAAYNAMIYPITSYNIAGAIWYQGEANVDNAFTYQELFSTMIGSWRKAWGKDFPFYFVQIAPFSGYGPRINASVLRDAQARTTSLSKTGMIIVSDLVDDVKDIHPKNKKDVGLRLANYALADTYGQTGIAFKSPVYKGMKVEKSKIRIFFDNADNGLMVKGASPTEFYIAGNDKVFRPASAKIDGNSVIVWNKSIKEPAAVRFGYTSGAMPNLFSKEGLPVNLFRTDEWNDVGTTAE